MKKLYYFLGICVVSSLLLMSCGGSQQNASEEEASIEVSGDEGVEMNEDMEETTSASRDRVLFAIMSTRMQNELSRMAEQKISTPAMKEINQTVTNANEEVIIKIEDLAEVTNVQVPDVLNTDQQRVVDSLQEMQPEEFEKAYLEVLVNDQQQLVDNLEELLSDEADNPIVTGLIEDIIDIQQPQLERLQAVQDEMM